MISPKLDHITVHVLTDWVANSKSCKNREVSGKTVRIEVTDVERLSRHLRKGRPRDEMVLDLRMLSGLPLPCEPVPERTRSHCNQAPSCGEDTAAD